MRMLRMKESRRGSPDGVTIRVYNEGEVFKLGLDMSEYVFDSFVEHGFAEELSPEEMPEDPAVVLTPPTTKAAGTVAQEDEPADEPQEVESIIDRPEPESEEEQDTVEYPVRIGGPWYELSNGERVKGKDAAEEAQRQLDE